MEILYPSYWCCYVTNQHLLCRFSAIHKSSPMALWDSEISLTFCQLFYEWMQTYYSYCFCLLYGCRQCFAQFRLSKCLTSHWKDSHLLSPTGAARWHTEILKNPQHLMNKHANGQNVTNSKTCISAKCSLFWCVIEFELFTKASKISFTDQRCFCSSYMCVKRA